MGGSYSPPVPTALLKERSPLKTSDISQENSHESKSFALQPPLCTVTFRVKRQITLTTKVIWESQWLTGIGSLTGGPVVAQSWPSRGPVVAQSGAQPGGQQGPQPGALPGA